MEKVMPPYRNLLLIATCALALGSHGVLHAQSAAEKTLLTRAQSLATSGHLDMAVQAWQQVLLADANNREALLGIARADMQMGKTDEARKYLERARLLGGNAADISKIEGMPNVAPQSVRLAQAARLAQQGRYADAMHIYHDIYGDEPPAGDVALAYYDTEAGIPESRHHAVEGLRKLSRQFPADSRYAITMGRILTYDPGTRAEGIAVLQQYGNVPAAQNALKQAVAWNARATAATTTPAPSAAPAITVAAPAPKPVPAGDNSLEGSAFRALNSGRLEEAQQRFEAILAKQPENARALSGMGYVSMKRQDFAAAASYLERARAGGTRGLDDAIATSRFWETMARAGDALKAGDTGTAIDGYRAALALKPSSPDAMEGLAGAQMQSGNPTEAAGLFERVVTINPQRATAWRGLFQAQSAAGEAQAALATNDRMPKTVRASLSSDPDYLRTLAQDYTATGRQGEADRTIASALSLPFPNQGRDLSPDKQMQYAALLMTAQRYEAALQLYSQVIAASPNNADAWRALIAAQHQLHRDNAALATVGRMPQSLYNQAQKDSRFLVLVGSIYQVQHEYGRAQRYLEKALQIGGSEQTAIELQLADIYAAEGDQPRAYAIYRRQLDQNPNSPQIWRGLIGSLHQGKQDREALRQIATMPEQVRLRLEEDVNWLQTVASAQSATGQQQAALRTFAQLSQIYDDQRATMPADVQIQYGWALLQAGDNSKLYALISNLSNAPDLTPEQQADFNSLWASWSIRRANAALASGESRKAIAILETAAQAFPQNADVYGALAGAYLHDGQAKRAVSVYSLLDMTHGSLPLYQGAIGAALAARDMKQAEIWLQTALDRYKDDATILRMAAQYEQARGDSGRAAAYYRAALDAMGPASPQEMFTHPGNSGVGAGTPGNGLSPSQQLMQLLAPGGHVAQSPTPTWNQNGDIQPGPGTAEVRVPTLGDFAQPGSAVEPEMHQAPARDIPQNQPIETAASENSDNLPGSQATYATTGSLSDNMNAPAETLAAAPQGTSTAKHRQRRTVATLQPPPSSQSEGFEPVSMNLPPHIRGSMEDDALPQPSPAVRTPLIKEVSSTPAGQLQMAVKELSVQSAQVQTEQEPVAPISPTPQPLQAPAYMNSETARAEASVLPPLRGPIVRSQTVKTPRQQIEDQLAVMQGAASGWSGGTASVDYRSGQPGYDRLAIFSGQAEGSGMLAPGIRATVIARPVLLDAGEATGTETFQQGTLPLSSAPYVQSASGIGGELQLRTSSFGASIGYTPHGFLVENVTGHLNIHPPTSHFTLDFGRDPIIDTQLSYAGLRDEGSVSPTYIGNVWGGVMTNSGELQLAFGDDRAGWYIQGGGQYITGDHVQTNKRFDGDGGAYWAAWHRPEFGNLTVGMNFFGMHYDRNNRYFTYGQGGYFSPAAYMLAAIPLTFNGHYGAKFHYRAAGSFGVQAFQEDSSPFFPLDPAIQAAQNNPFYPERTSVGGNYSFDGEGAYAIADHWYVGGYLNFNNSRDYASDKIGFFVRYLFRPQPANADIAPTGLFPVQGLRPLQVP